jgi:hypothetical protein
MKRVVIINGSPKLSHKASFSSFLMMQLSEICKQEAFEPIVCNARACQKESKEAEMFEIMAEADALVFMVPLYFFCLPGNLMQFLTSFEESLNGKRRHKTGVYAIVHCGFPEPDICNEAVEVLKCFSKSIGASFRFGAMIGGGSMIPATIEAPFMRKTKRQIQKAMETIKEDVARSVHASELDSNSDTENVSERPVLETQMIRANFPRRMYFFMGNRQWHAAARRNGLKTSDLYRRPHIY